MKDEAEPKGEIVDAEFTEVEDEGEGAGEDGGEGIAEEEIPM